MGFTEKIRSGTPDDVPYLYNLVHELAVFEKGEDELINTPDQMLYDAFGPSPVFEFIVATTPDNTIIGASIFYIRYSTWKGKCLYLEDLIVTEKYRKQGIGEQLFLETLNIAGLKNCQRMNWQVLDWNEPAIAFYKKLNATIYDGWLNGFIEIKS